MLSKGERIAFLYRHRTVCQVKVKKLRQHGKYLCIADELHLRVFLCDLLNISRMVRLHMIDHQIIRFFSVQRFFHIGQPFLCHPRIRRIHDCDLLIHDHIRIIRYSIRHMVLALEQINILIITSHIKN